MYQGTDGHVTDRAAGGDIAEGDIHVEQVGQALTLSFQVTDIDLIFIFSFFDLRGF